MTMHADQLLGAPVIDSDGQAVGTIEQVFRDDVDGTPSWARIRSGKGLHFVPLAGSSLTNGGGLTIPFDSQKIMKEPELSVDRHMSVAQEEELRDYFGLSVPAQAPPSEAGGQPGDRAGQAGGQAGQVGQSGAATKPDLAQPGAPAPGQATAPGEAAAKGMTQPGSARPGSAQPSQPARAQAPMAGGDQEWLVRSEERLAVDIETRESGRVKLHKHVDTEPVQQTVHVSHEEYEIERVPISGDDRIKGELADREQEVVLHETRAVINKQTVPVERVRLSVKKVEEDKTINDQLRKERIEIDSSAGQPASGSGGNAAGGRDPASGRDSGKLR
jgi:uncharacterized protein (TIGR02271 family)